jgi:hypothetical protein
VPYDGDALLNTNYSAQEVVDLTGAYRHIYIFIRCLKRLPGDIDMDTSIPSGSTINAAKEKRERLRKTGDTGNDFISLSVTKRQDYSQGPHPESRLVREDDELGEGDDGMPPTPRMLRKD